MSQLPFSDLQLRILQALAEDTDGRIDFLRLPDVSNDVVTRELLYLKDLELVRGEKRALMGGPVEVLRPALTARGRDALREDGGLTAAMNVVTVRLHADTIRDLLAAKINSSDLPEPEKKSLLTHVRDLPLKALEKAVERLVEVGLDHLPDAAQWLRTWVETYRTPGG